MIKIQTIDNTQFSINGIVYFKNFITRVIADKISIVNMYDTSFRLSSLEPYHHYEVDGDTYNSVAELQRALLPVVFQNTSGIFDDSRLLPSKTNPVLYWGSLDKIPKGWQLCDGTNGTPDLRGKFVVGYDPTNPHYNKIGNTGGADKVTLTIDEMPKHAPEGVTDATGGHIHDFMYIEWIAGGGIAFAQGGNGQYKLSKTSVDGEHVHKVKTNAIGNDKAHENRPPYFVLAWIIFTGANIMSSLLPTKSTSLEAAQILKHVDFDLISADLMHHDAVVEVSGVKHKVFYSKATLEDLQRELTSSITELYLDLKMYYWGISGENQKLDQVKVGFLTDDNRFFDFASPLKKVKDIVKDTTEAQIYKYTDCYLHMQNSLEDSQYFMMMFLNEFGSLYSKNCPSISISDATSLQIVAIYPDDAPVFEYKDPTNFRVNFTGKRYLFLQ